MTFTYAPGWAEPLFILFLFFLGLCIGSFLNVVIARVPEGLSIVRPGSRCPKCGHVLSWYENIPVLSWLGLRGRCRGCAMPISPRYVLVELLTGLLFLACLKRFDWTYALVPALVLVFLLVPLTFIDLEHWILPFSLTLPGIAAGVLLAIPRGSGAVVQAVVGAAVGFGAFRLMEYVGWRLFKREALGGGDKFLVALLGAFLGWHSLLGILFFSSLQGSIVGVALLALTGRAGPRGAAEQTGEKGAESAPPEVHAEARAAEAPPPGAGIGDAQRAHPPQGPDADAPVTPTVAATPEGEEEEPESTMTWDFTKPGLPLWKRVLLVPWCLVFQPIPDAPLDETGEEEEWVPGPTNIPFGPWLALAGLEVMLLGPWLARVLPLDVALMLGGTR
ncbi:A24 family peptidase [Corallococcus sp. Z5C101001]|uniref:prepilin peptidase n=1 Tax=Corallococcus sp. Z5C101001 TaxID=2596829 RepID=UPI00117D2D3E|nr:A24 family peptidase [Corallococcus sp. Z5C101001]TSC32261.1 prepilin peptidase [Corallococcus sp. Z5C101001]